MTTRNTSPELDKLTEDIDAELNRISNWERPNVRNARSALSRIEDRLNRANIDATELEAYSSADVALGEYADADNADDRGAYWDEFRDAIAELDAELAEYRADAGELDADHGTLGARVFNGCYFCADCAPRVPREFIDTERGPAPAELAGGRSGCEAGCYADNDADPNDGDVCAEFSLADIRDALAGAGGPLYALGSWDPGTLGALPPAPAERSVDHSYGALGDAQRVPSAPVPLCDYCDAPATWLAKSYAPNPYDGSASCWTSRYCDRDINRWLPTDGELTRVNSGPGTSGRTSIRDPRTLGAGERRRGAGTLTLINWDVLLRGPGRWDGDCVPYYACAPRRELGLRAMIAGALRRTALRVVRWTDRLEYPGLTGAEIRRERSYLRERAKLLSWGAETQTIASWELEGERSAGSIGGAGALREMGER